MSVQRAEPAQELLGQSDGVILPERVDAVALLMGQMGTRGLPAVLDRPLPRHGRPRSIRWGWTAVIWLASILTAGDQRHGAVATALTGMHHTLSRLTAPGIAPRDVRDDRWRQRLQHGSPPASWHPMAQALQARRLEVDPVPPEGIRGAAPTGSGAHAGTAGGR